MSAYPTPRFIPAGGNSVAADSAIDIAKWTEQTTKSLNKLSIDAPTGVRGTSVSLAIDLDEQKEAKSAGAPTAPAPNRPKRKLLRRDSLDRREALLRGKEGSRRRTRWENDRLLNNPWAQPPLPSDFEVHPTYPRHAVPYYLAPLWDQEVAARVEAKRLAKCKNRAKSGTMTAGNMGAGEGMVPREIRQRFKKSKASKGLLHTLEDQVRHFVTEGVRPETPQQASRPTSSSSAAISLSDDEEIIFVGRNGRMRDIPPSPQYDDAMDSGSDSEEMVLVHRPRSQRSPIGHVNVTLPARQKMVLESPVGDRSAGFGRWLVHVIATYYGLRTWSRTIGDPARREAYIGLPHTREKSAGGIVLPRPLYCLV